MQAGSGNINIDWHVLAALRCYPKQCLVTTLLTRAGPGGLELHAWALMSTVMTEVLSKADWLKLWDHVLSNSPPFFMFVLLAYFVYFREQILSAETQQQMEGITRRCNPVDLNKVSC